MPDLRKLSMVEKLDLGREMIYARMHRGLSTRDIAREFEVSYEGTRRLLFQTAQALSEPSVQADLRASAAAEYDQILTAYKGAALEGDKEAAGVWLKAASQRDSLLGLRIPVEQRISQTSVVAHVGSDERQSIIDRLVERQERHDDGLVLDVGEADQ